MYAIPHAQKEWFVSPQNVRNPQSPVPLSAKKTKSAAKKVPVKSFRVSPATIVWLAKPVSREPACAAANRAKIMKSAKTTNVN
jgi:hypothetical protein